MFQMIPERLLSEQKLPNELDLVVGEAAFYLDKMWLSATQQGDSLSFLDRLEGWVQHFELPLHFQRQRDYLLGRRQPSFLEAVTETAKRLRFLERFTSEKPDEALGYICGGSMSYGRFYSIRGGNDPSDIDFLLVVDKSFFNYETAQRLVIGPMGGFDTNEANLFYDRCRRFQNIYASGEARLMSQKFKINGYLFSLKVIPFEDFVWEFKDIPRQLVTARGNTEVAIEDYKPAPYADKDSPRSNFFRETYVFHGHERVLDNGEAITQVPAAVFRNNRFYTGDHHNHVIPKFEVLVDNSGHTTAVVRDFLEILKTEFDLEANNVDNGEQINFINILDRAPFLSPQVVVEARERFLR